MTKINQSREELLKEIQLLQERLTISEDTLTAIQHGEIDALVLSHVEGEKVFTLQSADYTYRLIVEQMSEGAVTITSEGWILYCNQSFANLLKYPLENIIGSQLQQFVPMGDATFFQALLRKQQAGETAVGELSLMSSEQKLIPVYISANQLQLDQTLINCIIITDLTDKKQNEEMIASEQFARSILEQAGETIIICDQNGIIIRASQVAHQLCGENPIFKSFDQLLNLHFYNSGFSHKNIDNSDINKAPSSLSNDNISCLMEKNCFSVTTILQGHEYHGVEVYLQCQNGHKFNLILSARPFLNSVGQIRAAIITLTDITERKRHEAELHRAKVELEIRVAERTAELRQVNTELQDSEAKFRLLSECSPIGIFLTDTQGQYIYTNPRCQAICGFTFAEALGEGWMKSIHPDDRELVLNQWFIILDFPQESSYREVRYLHEDGKSRYGQVLIAPVFTGDGEFSGYIGTVEDITESRAITQMKRDFVSIVSHELRTPLTAIHGSLGLLASGVYDKKPDRHKHMMTIAASQTDRLVRLVNDILSLQRLESGKTTLVKQSCNATILMQQSIDSMWAIAEQSQIQLNLHPLNVEVWANHDAIIQTLTNLLANAIKFSAPNTTIDLSATVINHIDSNIELLSSLHASSISILKSLELPVVMFKVQDHGKGILTDKLESIFDWFQQADASNTREKGGTGLGLAICRSIMRQHGGKIWAESVLDQGSNFYFTLSLASHPL